MSDKPAPMVPAEVDLRSFETMPLAVQLLRDSRFVSEVKPEAFRAAVLLWCASWHQVPAGSLPDNDIELAKLSGYGFAVQAWKKLRKEALQGFELCSDGRLYHREVAARALAAWQSRLDHFFERAKERLRKANKARAEEKPPLPPLPALTFEQWNADRMAAGIPPEKAEAFRRKAAGEAAGIPPEKALKGEGTEGRGNGEERDNPEQPSAPDGAGATAPPEPPAAPPPWPPAEAPPEPADVIFGLGLPLLTAANVSDRNARSMLGLMRKTHGDSAVIRALQRCATEKPLQPVAWLQAALKAPGGGATPTPPKGDRIALGNIDTVRKFAERTAT